MPGYTSGPYIQSPQATPYTADSRHTPLSSHCHRCWAIPSRLLLRRPSYTHLHTYLHTMASPTPPTHALPPGVTVFERGWLSSSNVLLVDGERAALVDTGYCTHTEQTLALVAKALPDRPLDLVLNTHLHSDHCGGNAALQSHYPELVTAIPPESAQSCGRLG